MPDWVMSRSSPRSSSVSMRRSLPSPSSRCRVSSCTGWWSSQEGSSCSGKGSPRRLVDDTRRSNVNNRTIRLGGFYRSLPMLVAEEKGFYSRFDIEMEFGQVSSSTQQFEFLADGRYDIVQTSPDNTANYRLNDDNPIGRRVDARGFLGLDYGMLLVLVARPEIESIGDLRGEVVSVDAPASGFAFVVYEILRN